MKEELIKLFNVLISDSKFRKDFIEKKQIQELYDLCVSTVDGYSLEEFKEFLKFVISVNRWTSNKIDDSVLNGVSGGFDFSKPRNKVAIALMGSTLIAGGTAHCLTNGSAPSQSLLCDSIVSENSPSEQNDYLKDIINNFSESVKKDFTVIAKTAEKCLDTIVPKVSASAIDTESVSQKTPKITSRPTASAIKYGQKIAESTLSGGAADVGGTFAWVDSTIMPELGKHNYGVKFTPNSANYNPVVFSVSVDVQKREPKIVSKPTASDIEYGQKISDSVLCGGLANVNGTFSWGNPHLTPEAGTSNCEVVFTPNDKIYKSVTFNVSVNVSARETKITSKPTASTIQYGQKIAESALRGGAADVGGTFAWVDSTIMPEIGKHNYGVKFTPNSANYNPVVFSVSVDVQKAEPKIVSKPTASDIKYGQRLSDSVLCGGLANADGTFAWSDSTNMPNAGDRDCEVTFTPSDPNYKPIKFYVKVKINKILPQLTSIPSVSDITYGQNLNCSQIYNFYTTVAGTVKWDNPGKVLHAGVHGETLVFTPHDSINYESFRTTVYVTVNKATPKLANKNFQATYKPNMILNDFSLPNGWVWRDPDTPLIGIGVFKCVATHYADNNYNKNHETVVIKIDKAEPSLSLSSITYSENQTLKDIKLPTGWHWINENEIPISSKSVYKARFNSAEAGTTYYHDRDDIDLKLDVRKADPFVKSWAMPIESIIYGDTLSSVRLSGGLATTSGTFKFVDGSAKLKAGEHRCKVIFVPDNSNYNSIVGQVSVTVQKNMIPRESPEKISESNALREDTSIKFSIKSDEDAIEFSKDGGKTWQDSPEFKNLSPKTEYNFVHRYKDTESSCTGKTSSVLKLSTKASAPSAPDNLRIERKTNHEIIFRSNRNWEFSKDGGKTWQDSPEFKGLKGNTEYKFIVRVKATDDHVAGISSLPRVVSTRSWFGNIWHNIFE